MEKAGNFNRSQLLRFATIDESSPGDTDTHDQDSNLQKTDQVETRAAFELIPIRSYQESISLYESISDISIESEYEVPVLHDDEDDTKLIRVTRAFRIRWDLFTMLLALWNAFSVPFFVAFHSELEDEIYMFILNTFIDVIFWMDVVMNFFTTYINYQGFEVMNHKKIIYRYLKRDFIIDLVASLPVDKIIMAIGDSGNALTALKVTDMLKMTRILRLRRIIRLMKESHTIKAGMNLAVLVFYLGLWVHFTGWIWWMIVNIDGSWIPVPDFLTATSDVFHQDIWTQYFTWFYHAAQLFVGGEVGARTDIEFAYAANIIIIGGIIKAIMFGEILVLVNQISQKNAKFQQTMGNVIGTMQKINMPFDYIEKVLDFLVDSQISVQNQAEYESFARFVSPSIMQKVRCVIFTPIMHRNPIFKRFKYIHDMIVTKMMARFIEPEEKILEEDEPGGDLYFLIDGQWDVWINGTGLSKYKVRTLHRGAHFGEIWLLYDTKRSATIISTKYWTITQLLKPDFSLILDQNPSLKKQMRVYASNTYNDKWRKYILGILSNVEYLQILPEETYREVFYYMNSERYDKNTYIIGPGDQIQKLYIITAGQVEISASISSPNLTAHMYNKGYKVHSVEKLKHVNMDPMFSLDVDKLNWLKEKPDIIPLEKDHLITGYAYGYYQQPQKIGQPLGDYVQEFSIAKLGPGSIMWSTQFLFGLNSQVQIKTLEPVTWYTLAIEHLRVIAYENNLLEHELLQLKDRYMPMNKIWDQRENKVPVIDYCSKGEDRIKKLFKTASMNALGYFRDKRTRMHPCIEDMVPKLTAMRNLKDLGKVDQVIKIARDELPFWWVDESGCQVFDSKMNRNIGRPHKRHRIRRLVDEILDLSDNKEFDSLYQETVIMLNSVLREISTMNKKLSQYEASVHNRPQSSQPNMDRISYASERLGFHAKILPHHVSSRSQSLSESGSEDGLEQDETIIKSHTLQKFRIHQPRQNRKGKNKNLIVN